MTKKNQKKNQIRFLATGILLILFILYTIALLYVDVKPIGPNGSSVAFATVNQFVHHLFGVHMFLYSLTDWLSLAVLPVILGFAALGLVQLIKRKSLLRVDSSILVLGGFYLLVLFAYLFFEFYIVNYRPVLIDGILEASYPSSTTVLVLCVIPTAMMQFRRLIPNKTARTVVNGFLGTFASVMVIGRMLSGVHWLTDVLGGILLSMALVMLYRSVDLYVASKQKR